MWLLCALVVSAIPCMTYLSNHYSNNVHVLHPTSLHESPHKSTTQPQHTTRSLQHAARSTQHSNQQSAISNQQSAISNQQPATSNQQSATSNQHTAQTARYYSFETSSHDFTTKTKTCISLILHIFYSTQVIIAAHHHQTLIMLINNTLSFLLYMSLGYHSMHNAIVNFLFSLFLLVLSSLSLSFI